MVIKIPIVSTYTDQGTKAAVKDVKGLDHKLKKGLKTLGLSSKLSAAAAVVALTKITKASLTAAAAEEKANKGLAVTLRNLGQGLALESVTKFTDELQRSSGVSEDVLKPALTGLLNVTGDVAASQELLKRALDISAGSGKDLGSVVSALQRAYSGNFTALGKLNVGLDKATLKSGDLDTIMAELNAKFNGQAAAQADTFSGSINKLKIASAEAAETLGTKLLVAVDLLIDKKSGIDKLGGSIEGIASTTGNALIGVSSIIKEFTTGLGVLNEKTGGVGGKLLKVLRDTSILKVIDNLAARGKKAAANKEQSDRLLAARAEQKSLTLGQLKTQTDKTRLEIAAKNKVLAKANAKAEAEAAAKAKKAAEEADKKLKITKAEAAAKTLADKQDAANKKLAAKFDSDLISIEAALKGSLTKEERARLEALKALRTETLDDDISGLKNLETAQAAAAAAAIANNKKIQLNFKTETEALAEYLKSNPLKIYAELVTSTGTTITAPAELLGAPGTAEPRKKSSAPTILLNTGTDNTPGTNATPPTNVAPTMSALAGLDAAIAAGAAGNNLTVNVNAGAIGNEQYLVNLIGEAVTKYQRFGGTIAPAGFI